MSTEADPLIPARIAVLTRFPEPGRAKTPLIPQLGPEGAADLHDQMVRHTLRRVDEFVKESATTIQV